MVPVAVGNAWNVVAESYLAVSEMAGAKGQCLHKMFTYSLQYYGPHLSHEAVQASQCAQILAPFWAYAMFAALSKIPQAVLLLLKA